MAPYVRDRRHLVGLIFVLIGLVLIIDNIRFMPDFIPWWIWTWQFLLITIGVFSLITSDKVGPGVVLIGVGTIFLLSDILPDVWPGFFDLFANDTNLFWYLVLIVVGVSLILRRKAHHSESAKDRLGRRGFRSNDSNDKSAFAFSSGDQDYIDEVAIFGGGKKIITSENFKGGKVTTIFGGMDLILTQSKLADGIVEIEVFAMFGGWTLVVPPTWQVKTDVVAIFGGITDKRMIGPENVRDNTQQLVVKGLVMFGGGEIKSY
ncbi:MAG: hypothetical protein KAI99_03885 [Cyclobacteriaceae bacterium]|nr:hypothetical protein [Cyclobacteriaceae bacterium]